MTTNLLGRLFAPEATGQWRMPGGTYLLIRTVHQLRRLFIGLSRLESFLLGAEVMHAPIDRPIYVCGIARSGTTVTLEMLQNHPDAACHYYYHAPLPYLPLWWDRIVSFLPIPISRPVERIHKDGLLVNQNSPDVMEERFWMEFFPNAHDETRSNVLDDETCNHRFEMFYRDHIRKLLFSQRRRRYLTKNNYNVTRLEYLLRLFPDARFLIVVRNPVNHIASLMKQHRLFTELEREQPRTSKWLNIVGHFEFGRSIKLIAAGDPGVTARVRGLWAQNKLVEGWAVYWASIYNFVADRLAANPALSQAAMVLCYDDLCADSDGTIDRILTHAGLSAEAFAEVKEQYVQRLRPPTYYQPEFTERDLAAIADITGPTASRFGYTL